MTNPGEINMFLTEAIRAEAQKRIGDRLFKAAPASLEDLHTIGEMLAVLGECVKPGTTDPWVYYGPIKGRERANEKVQGEYGGEWLDLKDVVRMTIIAPTQD